MNRPMLPNNIFQVANQLAQNPAPFIQRAKYNVPQGLSNSNDIIQHLMNTGQVSQQKYNWARQIVEQMRGLK